MTREDIVDSLLKLAADAADAMDRRIVFIALESLKTFLTDNGSNTNTSDAIAATLERLKKAGIT